MKDNKNRLFEIFNKVSNIKLDEDYSNDGNDNNNDLDVIVRNKKLPEEYIVTNWDKIDRNLVVRFQKLSERFMDEYWDDLNKSYVSVYQDLSEPFMDKHWNELHKEYISIYQDLSEPFMDKHWNELDYELIAQYQKLSEEFIDKHWGDLMNDKELIGKYQNISDEFKIKHNMNTSNNKNRLFEIMNKVTGMKLINEDINRDSMYNGQQTQVKIIKCGNPMYWYANYIGQTITVVPDDSRTNWADGKEKWKVVPDNKLRGVNYVNKEDCQPIGGGISENNDNIGDTHLVDDLYTSDFIGKNMKYGSPGYPMTFIPRDIKDKGNGVFEFIGDMPGATIGTEGHYFTIGENELEELELNGEVSWIGPDGAHLYLSF